MIRYAATAMTMAALSLAAPGAAEAQFEVLYPGSTAPGDWARGDGVFLLGLGRYNVDTANAAAIDARTRFGINQYLYGSQLEQERRYTLRLRDRQERIGAANRSIARRLSEDPTPGDIDSGRGLNALFDQLASPRLESAVLRWADRPLPEAMMAGMPLQHNAGPVTISAPRLLARDGWPAALQDSAFAAGRRAYEQAAAEALDQCRRRALGPGASGALREAVRRLRDRAERMIPAGDPRRAQALIFLVGLDDMARGLGRPEVAAALADLESAAEPGTAGLVATLKEHRLRFAAATTPRERRLYQELYPLLARHRDAVAPLLAAVAPAGPAAWAIEAVAWTRR